jgi:hypothetical protein
MGEPRFPQMDNTDALGEYSEQHAHPYEPVGHSHGIETLCFHL